MQIELRLPDGSVLEKEAPLPVDEAIASISEGLLRQAVAISLDGRILDRHSMIREGGEFRVLTNRNEESLAVLRHSAAHLMACAIQELYPGVQFAFGPDVENGFYYDILLDRTLVPDDLGEIEKRMKALAKQKIPFVKSLRSREEAREFFQGDNQPFKVEHVSDLPEDAEISFYEIGSFTDLCEGPHIPDTSLLKAFRLQSIAGAYWKGDESREQLQRIYGTCWFKASDLEEHLKRLEEAERRDHRRLGPQLGLYGIVEEAGGGLPFWFPKGTVLREQIENFWKEEHRSRGYQMVMTPHIFKGDLWRTSGHLDFYAENMYTFEQDEQTYVLKPMNCPGHILVFQNDLKSYRDLPLRLAELGTVYRYERSGTLHGLMRVRGFTQDDAHIFCRPEDLLSEVSELIRFSRDLQRAFGFEEFRAELSVRDSGNKEKYIGTDEEWEAAEASLLQATEEVGLEVTRMEGEAVFYGPKIDMKLRDALGRSWQTTTIQFDFNLPRRFNVQYVGEDGQHHSPYIIHRALLGSLERFIAILTEHYGGEFPLWMAPVQAKILPLSEHFLDYGKQVTDALLAAGIRAELDTRDEKLGYKIRMAELQKIPYMLILGSREMEEGNLTVRSKKEGDLGSFSLQDFTARALDEIREKA
ncbi:MAG: threonine--tRNA ligase [Candidatus Krumholzibacteria bacterium]|nr:threonine--tRNA ligase [Candidatus Krumholzibacteria bacterium]MDP6669177.1 threonine--tRNA ligase [Candidatus Krumholzibacteria bacterium]MDP6797951.1 threonine--tRNA ligase [Candidatus Krumholzibacteria bacterium]MDP7020855.1 threonine--tRNA ligase [Candidatus Krumholzibacteria bacterium]